MLKEGLFIGLMSGTSMDGIDVALTDIRKTSISLIEKINVPYPKTISSQLEEIVLKEKKSTPHELATLDINIGRHFGMAANRALKKQNLKGSEIIAIGSHGQTVKHSPAPPTPYSLQIGHGAVIAALTGITTVADFRSLDVALGGQGAPLVPAFHDWCFGPSNSERIILNIGGIANINSLSDHPIALDTGPGNCLMDEWTKIHLNRPYDENGSWAASGKIIPSLLKKLLDHEYFKKPPPKSTGRELFNIEFLERTIAESIQQPESPEDIQATLLMFSVESIKTAITLSSSDNSSPIFICGGGYYNKNLVKSLQLAFPMRKISSTDALGYCPSFIEAAAFSWLAYMRVNNLPVKLVTSDTVKYLELGAVHA